MSETPRMDSVAGLASGIVDAAILAEGMNLERELNAANDRIKRLEEAGDALKASGYFGGFGDAVNKWVKVREGQP